MGAPDILLELKAISTDHKKKKKKSLYCFLCQHPISLNKETFFFLSFR